MKTPIRHGKPAFSLIEMMAVITIIVILAALVIGALAFVQDRQAKEKARVQMALISKALEDFKLANGFYPPGQKTPGGIGPADNIDPITRDAAITQSRALYTALYWDTDFDGIGATKPDGQRDDEDQPIYLAELDPETNTQGWISGTGADAYIIDPWGNPYAYRSAVQANGAYFEPTQNPDFDLWSYGKDGRTNISRTHKDSRDDILNQ